MIRIMTADILIGNTISMAAGCFTAASSLARTRKWIYLHQVFQCCLLAVASLFFGSLSGVVTFLLCVVRNALLCVDRFDKKACFFFVAALLAVGLPVNNLGLWGTIPVLASVGFTIGGLIAKKEISIKLNIMTELVLWLIYELHILDISSAIVDGGTILLTFMSIIRALQGKHDTCSNEIPTGSGIKGR